MRDVESTIISQYGNSATISKLIHNMNDYIDPTANLADFYDWVWNVETARGFGLDIWGRIVNVSREILTNPVYYLQDDAYRQLILLKALSNISLATNPSINQLLMNWVGTRGRAYVTDLGSMAIVYVFEFVLEPFEILIIQNSGIFLRPAGVEAAILDVVFPCFGFAEMGTEWITPFDVAAFYPGVTNAD